MKVGELLDRLEQEAIGYRLQSLDSIIRNTSQNELCAGDYADIAVDREQYQRVVDAVLADFINHIAEGYGGDRGQRVGHLKKQQLLQGGRMKRAVSVVGPAHAVACATAPFIPSGWSIREEDQLPKRVRGIFIWDPARAKLYLSKRQNGGKHLVGTALSKELANKPNAPANILDHLLEPENQHLIPENWKGKRVFFWGTRYRSSDGRLCIRYLYWGHGDKWDWGTFWLGRDFCSDDPALVLAR